MTISVHAVAAGLRRSRHKRQVLAGRGPSPMRAAGLLALLLLAGCATPAHGPAPPAAPAKATAAPRTLDWAQADCQALTWSVPVAAASLKPYLPPGFEPMADGPAGAGGAATIGFRTMECATGFGQAHVVRSAQSGQVFTSVVLPPGLRDDRFGTHTTYGWDLLVANDDWRAAAAPWGMPVHDGGALVGPSAQGWSGDLAMDRAGTFTIAGRTFDAGAKADGYESRMATKGAQGFALWDAEVANLTVADGAGLWSASPESWVAKLLGATQGAATFEYATFSLPRASVHWPGESAGPVDGHAAAGGGPEPPSPPFVGPLGPPVMA